MPEPTDARLIVSALLEAAGLVIPAADIDSLVEAYLQLRAAADSFNIPEVRAEEPALLYAPRPAGGTRW